MLPLIIAAIENDDDREYFTDIYINYYGLMKRQALSVVKIETTAEDIVHEAIIKLIDKVVTLRGLEKNCALPAYLVSTVRRCAINYVTRTKNVVERNMSNIDDEIELVAVSADVEQEVMLKISVEQLKTAILKLSKRDQDVLNFKYLIEMDDAEIAECLGIKKNSVRQYLTTARRKALVIFTGDKNNG